MMDDHSTVAINPAIIADPTQQCLPPAPQRISECIINCEFIHFITLLPKAILELGNASSFMVQLPSNSGNLSVCPAEKPTDWMEAWNIYLAICVDHMPSHAPSFINDAPFNLNSRHCWDFNSATYNACNIKFAHHCCEKCGASHPI